MEKIRLDKLLVDKKLVGSIKEAQAKVRLGDVLEVKYGIQL